MKQLQKFSKFLSDYTSIVVIAIAVITFFLPSLMGWVNFQLFTDPVANKFTSQSIIIGVIMFSMGLTLTTEDFKILAQRPFDICIGAIAQYLIMPFLAFFITKLLHLPTGIALGLILVGCCPGGVSSNIMSYLCGGDVAFSVGMTTVSTLIAPIVTPMLVYLLGGKWVEVSALSMMVSTIKVVLVPILLGIIVHKLLGNRTEKISEVMPAVSVVAIVLIICGIVGKNASSLLTCGIAVGVVVMLHNSFGLLLGFAVAKLLRLNTKKSTAIAIEVGMQNSGLAVSLAATNFAMNPLAAVPGAIFSVWHNISGALFASYMKRKNDK